MIFEPAAWSLPLGVAMDALIGDPRGWPHPVRWIGGLISATERALRATIAGAGPRSEKTAGVVLVLVVVASTGGVAWAIASLCDHLHPLASLAGRTLMIHFALAARSLRDETLKAAEAPDLPGARRELAMIVGRDTADLPWAEVHRACLETVAENAADGVIAPLFWYAVGGPVGMWIYKAINTLDSMVGYRNERYRHFGWASARLDDAANFAPARLSWLLLVLAAWICGESPRDAWKIGLRDGRNHPSPNSAWSEAAMAGALRVQLGGPATYGGVPGFKPLLGEPGEAIGAGTVRRAIRLMSVASLMAALMAWAIRVGIFRLA